MPVKKQCECNRHRKQFMGYKPVFELTPEEAAAKMKKKLAQMDAYVQAFEEAKKKKAAQQAQQQATSNSTYTFTYTSNPFGGNTNGGQF